MADEISIVLTPGYMLDRDLWSDIEAGLVDGLPGRVTLRHADLSKDGSIETMAQRLLDDAPERFVLVGFSMGGYVAREALRRAPERVSALILIATSSRGDTEIQARRKEFAAHADVSAFTSLSRSGVLPSMAPANASETRIERIRAMSERLGGEVFRRQSSLARPGDTDRLAEIACPTLIIAAAEDRLRGLDESQELQAGIAGSSLVVIPGSGHMIPMEAPGELLAVVVPWLRATLA